MIWCSCVVNVKDFSGDALADGECVDAEVVCQQCRVVVELLLECRCERRLQRRVTRPTQRSLPMWATGQKLATSLASDC